MQIRKWQESMLSLYNVDLLHALSSFFFDRRIELPGDVDIIVP